MVSELLEKVKQQRFLLILLLPGVILTLMFQYFPMYGLSIAFKSYNPFEGIWGSPWAGFEHFKEMFESHYFWRALRNTLIINVYQLIFGFTAPIVFALLLNELRNSNLKRWVQTITYFPHFLSWVVVGGFVVAVMSPNTGLITIVKDLLGLGSVSTFPLIEPTYFRSIIVSSDIWKSLGWGAIIYLAAITGVNPEYYDAAVIDGANRFRQMISVTLPLIMPAIIIMFVLRIGNMMYNDFEQIYVLYSPTVYEVGDVLQTYIFREGLFQSKYSLTTAVGLFQSLIGFLLILTANKISRRVDGGLW